MKNIYQVLRISEELLAGHLTEVVNLQSTTLLHHIVIRVVFPGIIFMQIVPQHFHTRI